MTLAPSLPAFADAGFTDLFIAYPIWAAGVRGRRLRALAERVALRVGVDSSEGLEVLTRALAGTEAEVVVALTAAATVVSRHGRNLVLDVGSKVLGGDRPAWAAGSGRLLDYPQARVSALSEHHATVTFPQDASLPELGSAVRLIPYHVCARSTSPMCLSSPLLEWS